MSLFTPLNSNLAAARNVPYDLYYGFGPLQDLGFFNVPGVIATHLIKVNGKVPSQDPVPSTMMNGDIDDPSVLTWEPVSYDGIYAQYPISVLVLRFPVIGDVAFMVTTGAPSGTAATDKAAIATAMDALLTNVSATVGLTIVPPAGGIVRPANSNVTDAQIVAALNAVFASDGTGYVATAGVLTCTASADGAANNDIGVMAYVQNGVPTPRVTLTTAGTPAVPMLQEFGAKVDYKDNNTNKTATVPDDTTQADLGTFQTGVEGGFTVTLQQGRDYRNQIAAYGNFTKMSDENREFIAPGGRNELLVLHYILVRPGIIAGAKEFVIVPAATSAGFEETFNKEGIPTIALVGKPQTVAGYAKSSMPGKIKYTDVRAA